MKSSLPTVCVIGAGSSGLPVVKALQQLRKRGRKLASQSISARSHA